MSTHGFGTTAETLLYLAWASRLPGLRQELERTESRNHEQLLRNWLIYPLPPVSEQNALYGPLFEQLLAYRLNQVEFLYVGWALRGYASVFLKAEEHATEDQEPEDSLSAETTLLWDAIVTHASLHAQVKRLEKVWDESRVRQGARLLRLHFSCYLDALIGQGEYPFLVQEFIRMSLERVDWLALAARIGGMPYVPLPPLGSEEEEEDDQVVLLAALKATIQRGYREFGRWSQHPKFSRALSVLCTSLADQHMQTYEAVIALEEATAAFEP